MKNKTIKTLMFVFLGLFVVGVFLISLCALNIIGTSLVFPFLSMSIIGFMCFSICTTNLIYKKKFPNKNEIASSSKKEAVPFFVKKEKKKYVVCSNCKCKYEKDILRCPNCGAPPNF